MGDSERRDHAALPGVVLDVYGWPCGEQPEYGDQIYQDRSWGRFVPFGFDASEGEKDEITVLATVEGEITPAGLRSQGGRESVTGKPMMERAFKV